MCSEGEILSASPVLHSLLLRCRRRIFKSISVQFAHLILCLLNTLDGEQKKMTLTLAGAELLRTQRIWCITGKFGHHCKISRESGCRKSVLAWLNWEVVLQNWKMGTGRLCCVDKIFIWPERILAFPIWRGFHVNFY